MRSVGEAGEGHPFAETTFLEKILFETADLLVGKIVGQLDQANHHIGRNERVLGTLSRQRLYQLLHINFPPSYSAQNLTQSKTRVALARGSGSLEFYLCAGRKRCAESIPVMFRLVGPFHRHPEIIGLLPGQLRELHPDFF